MQVSPHHHTIITFRPHTRTQTLDKHSGHCTQAEGSRTTFAVLVSLFSGMTGDQTSCVQKLFRPGSASSLPRVLLHQPRLLQYALSDRERSAYSPDVELPPACDKLLS